MISGLGALALALVTFSGLAWLNLDTVERTFVRDQQAVALLLEINDAQQAVLSQQAGLRGYVISANPAHLRPYDEGRVALATALDRLTRLTRDEPTQARRVRDLAALTAAWRRTVAEPEIAAVRRGARQEATALVDAAANRAQMAAISEAVFNFKTYERLSHLARSASNEAAFRTARWMLLFGAVVAMAIAALIGGRALALMARSRRAAEQAEAFMRAIIEGMPAMLAIKSAQDLRFEFLNRAGEEFMGGTRDQIIGKNAHDLLPPEQARQLDEVDMIALANPDRLTFDEQAIATRSGPRHLAIRKIVVETPDGLRHLVAISTDITRLKEATAALEEALGQAQAAARAKTEFLANMSHEMRTPLNGVTGMAEALSRTPLDARQATMLRTLREAAAGLDTLFGDLLSLSRTAGEVASPGEAFQLGGAARAAVAEHAAAARSKGLRLTAQIAGDAEVRVLGDAGRLHRLLGALLSNAVKFTEAGAVSLTLEPVAAGRYRFEIADTGVGMDPAERERLFEEFARSDTSATRAHGGAGLGLAIARQCAAALGATLAWESAPGAGSRFAFEVDFAPEAAAAQPQPPDVLAAEAVDDDDARALRVLIVDDNPTNRQILELILDSLGAEWLSVENGVEAVEAAGQQAFDAILMDIQMPEMDGITATREIRRREREAGLAPVPVIIVSANCQPEHIRDGREAGAQAHLPKPIGTEALIGALSQVLAAERKVASAAG